MRYTIYGVSQLDLPCVFVCSSSGSALDLRGVKESVM